MSTLTAARPGWVTLSKVSGSSLPTSVSGSLLVSLYAGPSTFRSSAQCCEKQRRKLSFFHSRYDSSNLVPSASSERLDNRLPTEEGKQTSQESVSNQTLVSNVDCHGGSQAQGYQK